MRGAHINTQPRALSLAARCITIDSGDNQGIYTLMKKLSVVLATLALCASLTACERVTSENYDKLEVGMPYSEVVEILGEPAECTAVVNTKSCRWGKEGKYIDAKIVGESVIFLTAKGV